MPELLMIVGSLNRDAPYFRAAHGLGLSVFRFDPATGRAELICEERSVDNPTFLSVAAGSRCIYATSEVYGWHEGLVSAYRYDPEARRLIYLNKQPSLGSVAAHSSLDAEARHLFVANYGMGPEEEGPDRAIAVYPLSPDGALAPPVASLRHGGRGLRSDRQERAHPHCVLPSPDGRFAIVADLGLDALFTYRYGPDGTLSPAPVATMPMPPGSGPRHFAFHPGGRLAVVIRELDSSISSLRFEPDTGGFTQISTVSTLPDGTTAENSCSDVQIHPGGKFVYGANRGHDSIATFSLDGQTGHLAPIGHRSCGGKTPRNLAIDPTGRYLIVANQDSDTLSVLAIEDGRLAHPVHQVPVGSPMCVKFLAL